MRNSQTTTRRTKQQYVAAVPTFDSPMELNCFICNANYWTSVTPDSRVSQTGNTGSILTFCNLFLWEAEDKEQLHRLGSLTDPFCSLCAHKLSQVQDWYTQIELLQKAIENLKIEVGQLMVRSFPSSPNIQGTYNVKAKIVRGKKRLLIH